MPELKFQPFNQGGMKAISSTENSPISLNVVNLSYEPNRSLLYFLVKLRDYVFSSKYIKDIFPQIVFDYFNPVTLENVNFRCFQGQITAILSNDSEELRTIMEFLVNLRTNGIFDGEILIDGVDKKIHYNDAFAFVPKVCRFCSRFNLICVGFDVEIRLSAGFNLYRDPDIRSTSAHEGC